MCFMNINILIIKIIYIDNRNYFHIKNRIIRYMTKESNTQKEIWSKIILLIKVK